MNKLTSGLLSKYNFIVAYFLIIAFDSLFPNTGTFGVVILLIIPLWGFVFLKDYKQFGLLHISCIVFCLYTLILLCINGDMKFQWGFPSRLWALCIAITLADEEEQGRIFRFIPRAVVVTVFVANMLTFLCFPISRSSNIMSFLPEYFASRFSSGAAFWGDGRLVGYYRQPNQTGMVALSGFLAGCICLSFSLRWKIVSIVTIVTSAIIITLTTSRSCLLSITAFVFCTFVVWILMSYSSCSKKMRKAIIVSIFVILLVFILSLVLIICNDSLNELVRRKILRINIDDNLKKSEIIKHIWAAFTSASGRDGLIEHNYNQFKESPVFGVSVYELNADFGISVHNGFLLLLFSLGIVGFAIYIVMMLSSIIPFIRGAFICKKENLRRNALFSLIAGLMIAGCIENSYEAMLAYHQPLECSFFYSVFFFAYMIGKRVISGRDVDDLIAM